MIVNQRIIRPEPKMPTHLYKSYVVKSPISTHFRLATCEEVECNAYTNGWTYRKADLDESLLHIVTHAGKSFREATLNATGDVFLVFEPGQECFQASTHRMTLDRPEFYFAGRGDWRSFSHRKAQQFNVDDWVDSFANHLDKINREIEKG